MDFVGPKRSKNGNHRECTGFFDILFSSGRGTVSYFFHLEWVVVFLFSTSPFLDFVASNAFFTFSIKTLIILGTYDGVTSNSQPCPINPHRRAALAMSFLGSLWSGIPKGWRRHKPPIFGNRRHLSRRYRCYISRRFFVHFAKKSFSQQVWALLQQD